MQTENFSSQRPATAINQTGKADAREFAKKVLAYYDQSGRKHLPRQQNTTPYRVWLSEIMLQQTQVATVIPYFKKFTERYPDIQTLAAADDDEVMGLWAGLGYYNRARNMLKCARIIAGKMAGEFPQTQEALQTLPGIGRSTAGAIASLAMGKATPILDGNVKRVLARVFCVVGWYGQAEVLKQLWQLSETLTPTKRTGQFNQAMMDLGATVCKRSSPLCSDCPLNEMCLALQQDRVAELPTRKPAKTQPIKNYHFLFDQNPRGEILLEKRPPSGIWGSLWCLPVLDQAQIKNKAKPESRFVHVLTHFKMQIHIWRPQQLRAQLNTQVSDAASLMWHNNEQIQVLGLPTPIRDYLNASETN